MEKIRSKYNGVPEQNPHLQCPICDSTSVILLPWIMKEMVYSQRGNGHQYGIGRQSRKCKCRVCGHVGFANGPDGFLKDQKYQGNRVSKVIGIPPYDFDNGVKVNPCLGQK